MSHYNKDFVNTIIRNRAIEKRERLATRRLNPDSVRPSIPFPEWLRYSQGIADWSSVKPYRLWNLFLDYQLDCVRCNMEWDEPSLYGLYNVLP